MTHYIFHEPGSIPGVPGTFAHCLVEVPDDGGEPIVTPLAQQPHILKEDASALAASEPVEDAPPAPAIEAAPAPVQEPAPVILAVESTPAPEPEAEPEAPASESEPPEEA